MVFADFLGAVRRRWYVLLVGLLLTGALGWGAAVLGPSDYKARGLVMLLPSAQTTGPRGNPLLNLGGLELPARVLVAYYSSEPAQAEYERLAPTAEVTVSMEESTRGPIIAVDVKDSTPQGALDVLHHVVDSIPDNLTSIQQEVGTPKSAIIGSTPLILDTKAQDDLSDLIRLVIAAVVIGLAATAFLVFAIDGIILRRSRNGRGRRDAGSDGSTPDETDADPGQADQHADDDDTVVEAPAEPAATEARHVDPPSSPMSPDLDDTPSDSDVDARVSVTGTARAARRRTQGAFLGMSIARPLT